MGVFVSIFPGMKSARHTFHPGRWIAAATGLTGLVCLALILKGDEVDIARVYVATTLFIVGTLQFIKQSMSTHQWERTVNGPEARRFLAISLGISALMILAGVIVLIGWVFRTNG